MGKYLSLFFLLLFQLPLIGFTQETFTISGVVRDDKEILPGAAIYLSGYKISTVANNEGKFSISGLAPGNYDVLVQMMGYLPFSKPITITNKSVTVALHLTENSTLLKEVVIKPNPDRAFQIALFKDFFLGKTPNAKACKILNIDILSTYDDRKAQLLTVSATDFLIIENQNLGYRIKYLLDNFEYNYKDKMVFFAGHSYFEELKGSAAKQKKWKKNRDMAYYGSIQHFYRSLSSNSLATEGYVINKLGTIPNPNRKPDSLINAKIKKLTSGQQGANNLLTFRKDDSLAYWLKQRGEPKEFNVINRKEVLVDTLVKKINSELSSMHYTDALYVIYKKELESESYAYSNHHQNRPPDLGRYQISVVYQLQAPVLFYESGVVVDPKSLLYTGYWAYEKTADLVPLSYVPYEIKK